MFGSVGCRWQSGGDCVWLCLVVGGSQEVTVSFAPDHISDHFSDGVHIELFGEVRITLHLGVLNRIT